MRSLFAGIENPFKGKRVVGLTTIRPNQELMVSSLDFNPESMRKMVDQGYRKAKEIINKERARRRGFFD
ncbi:MAG: hypothetical protein ACUVTN_08155 [Thermodesulfobacteriota bacterium]